MVRYLLYDSTCSHCSDIAAMVEQVGAGWLEARSLEDPRIREVLDRVRPGWKARPMLVSIDGDRIRVSWGPAMALRMFFGLGPRRTLRLLTSAV